MPECVSSLNRRIIAGLLLACLSGSCAPHSQREGSRDNAFTSYFGGAGNEGSLRLAVKDLIDMRGLVTTAGSEYLSKSRPPAKQDAECLAIARGRKDVHIVGKANLTEFAITVSGRNGYFGTPVNRLDGKHKFIPGGSSSGSAVAVATELEIGCGVRDRYGRIHPGAGGVLWHLWTEDDFRIGLDQGSVSHFRQAS